MVNDGLGIVFDEYLEIIKEEAGSYLPASSFIVENLLLLCITAHSSLISLAHLELSRFHQLTCFVEQLVNIDAAVKIVQVDG